MSTPETVVDVSVPEVQVDIDPLVAQLNSMTELISALAVTSKSLTNEMKALTKDVNKLRASKKGKGKKEKKPVDPDAPKRVNALEKPVKISDELSTFLGFTVGEMISRQQVTLTINKFVKEHKLQDPSNGRYILLESEQGLKLKALLRDPDQPLTFFNIQRYLKPHYLKDEVSEESKSAQTTARSESSTESAPAPAPAPAPVPVPAPVPATETAPATETGTETATATETGDEAPKKKVVRRVVKKA
jgi:chromatin remodeling complex protein RSC6